MGNSNSFDMRGSQFDDDGFMSAEGPIQQQFDEPEVAEVKHSNPQFFYKMKVQLIQLFLWIMTIQHQAQSIHQS